MERPKCGVCDEGSGIVVIEGYIMCEECYKEYRAEAEKHRVEVIEKIRGERDAKNKKKG